MKKKITILTFVFYTAFFAQTINVKLSHTTNSDSLLKDLSGVISGPLPSYNSLAPDITEQLKDIGVTSIRNNDYTDDRLDMERLFNSEGPLTSALSTYPNWKGSPTDDANYFWSSSDSLFASYLSGGFEPLFRIGGESGCAIKDHDYKGPRPSEESNYISAAKKVVEHYLHYNGSEQNFDYLNIWTEYPNNIFWDRTPFAFNHFWKNIYTELKSEFPNLKIGGPGFLVSFYEYETDPTSERVGAAITFLDTLYQNGIKPDWLGFHYIYNSVALLQKDIDYFKKLLSGNPPFDFVPWSKTGFFDNIELFCDAYMLAKFDVDSLGNTTELNDNQIDELFNRSRGASLLTAYWILLQRNRIEKAYYYRSGDSQSDPSLSPNNPNQKIRRGLFWGNSEATYKKTAYSFKLQNSLKKEGYNHILKFDDQMTIGTDDSLWIIGAEKNNMTFSILASNISSKSKKVNFTIDDIPINTSNYNIEFKIVDENSDGDIWKTFNFTNLILNPYSVTLIKFTKIPTSVKSDEDNLFSYRLSQNYPNPFNPTTNIKYEIGKRGFVKLKVYNSLGQKITTLVNRIQNPGVYDVSFNASSIKNLTSGIYYYNISVGNYRESKKMLLIK